MCVLQHLRWRICESGKDVCKSMEFQDSGKHLLKSMEFQDPVRVPKNETFNLRNSKARNTKNRSKTAALCWCAGLLYRLHNFWALGWRGKNPENTTHPGGTWGFGKKTAKIQGISGSNQGAEKWKKIICENARLGTRKTVVKRLHYVDAHVCYAVSATFEP